METKSGQIIDWIERLIEEKLRLESIKSKREELRKRNIGEDLIQSSIDESKRRVEQAKSELTHLMQQLECK